MPQASFRLEASERDFERYFPTYLANGCFSAASSLRGTEATLTLVAGLMDRTPGDVSRPGAIPAWTEIDYSDGTGWLNEGAVTPAAFRDYKQTLDMYDGVLSTQYSWRAQGSSTGVSVATLVSQADFHLAATSVSLIPDFSGTVKLLFPLRAWPAPSQRLPLATLSWEELKETLAQGSATRAMPAGMVAPQARPKEILTWFDLQEALAAAGRILALPSATAPTRAAVWYPGEVAIRSAQARLEALVLSIEGTAVAGSRFGEAVAIELPVELSSCRRRVIDEGDGRGVTIEIEAEETPSYAAVNAEREIHLNGDIAIAQWQYFQATGDERWLREQGYPVIEAAADFYVSRVTHVGEHDRYEIHHVTSVDEKYTDVNNDAYTNAVAQKTLIIATRAAEALGHLPNARWLAARVINCPRALGPPPVPRASLCRTAPVKTACIRQAGSSEPRDSARNFPSAP